MDTESNGYKFLERWGQGAIEGETCQGRNTVSYVHSIDVEGLLIWI
jgi:hypothetical protein